MTDVYVLTREYPYEPGTVLGAYSDLESAQAAAWRHAQTAMDPDELGWIYPDHEIRWRHETDPMWIYHSAERWFDKADYNNCAYYMVHRFEVGVNQFMHDTSDHDPSQIQDPGM
ncbi:hypothetical protein [Rhodococcus sp. 11-3]|uniref:hypothetical protein n=1 Tax=Rhodococcus sp. 11-3 TaxID=2854796 RepID=UPI00203D6B3A|nr:hypothetical protein [Rhodococcus sp. 11-3]USC17069.1 hypothetical protein KZJ41_09455 [Rhodococcus sp. 11-3]